MFLNKFDLFHVGHVNLLKQAKEHCDYLIVGVNDDDLMYDYKNKHPIINEDFRKAVVESCKYVDECHVIDTRDRNELYNRYHFDILMVSTDWQGSDTWKQIEKDMAEKGVKVIYLQHTPGISSTSIRNCIQG